MTHRLPRIVLAGVVAIAAASIPGMARPAPAAAAGPSPAEPMIVHLAAGKHTGYTFDMATGAVTGTKTATLSKASRAYATDRATIPGRGIHLFISNSSWAGYWMRESVVAHINGPVAEQTFDPPRTIRIPAGNVLGVKFDSAWDLGSARLPAFSTASSALASGSAVIDGTLYYRMLDGPLAGTWVASWGFQLAKPLRCHTGPRAGGGAATWSQLSGAGAEVALTLDLGGRTDPALAIAKRLLLNGVCTTIFPTGDAAVTAAGNAVVEFMDNFPAAFEFGNHTKDHCNFVSGGGDTGCPAGHASTSFVQSQLNSAGSTIQSITGQNAKPYWRPPYGSHDASVRSAAAAIGYTKTVMWHIDTIDWLAQADGGPSAAQIIAKVVGGAGNGSIVLMHLGGWNTYGALPGMIHGLRGRGFSLTSVSDLADGQ